MIQRDMAQAVAVIYDPIRGNMLTTRGVLHGMGFRRIDGITSFHALERRLKDVEVSILFIEASEEAKVIVELVQKIRLGETKANPFLPIIATLWTGSSETVASLMNSGCDDVLLRPFSVVRVKERVAAIIDNRKKFVVTSDYVGPDRGVPKSGHANVESFEVPNPLRNMVFGEQIDPVAQNELVEEARKRVNKERLAKLARRIAMAAEVTIQAKAGRGDERGFIVDLLETSTELVKTAKRMGQDDVQDIASVLENVIAKVAIGHSREENATLARQLAMAIYVAYAVDEGEVFKAELEKTMIMVRSRLENAKIREKRKRDLSNKLDVNLLTKTIVTSDGNTEIDVVFEDNEDFVEAVVSKYNLLR